MVGKELHGSLGSSPRDSTARLPGRQRRCAAPAMVSWPPGPSAADPVHAHRPADHPGGLADRAVGLRRQHDGRRRHRQAELRHGQQGHRRPDPGAVHAADAGARADLRLAERARPDASHRAGHPARAHRCRRRGLPHRRRHGAAARKPRPPGRRSRRCSASWASSPRIRAAVDAGTLQPLAAFQPYNDIVNASFPFSLGALANPDGLDPVLPAERGSRRRGPGAGIRRPGGLPGGRRAGHGRPDVPGRAPAVRADRRRPAVPAADRADRRCSGRRAPTRTCRCSPRPPTPTSRRWRTGSSRPAPERGSR